MKTVVLKVKINNIEEQRIITVPDCEDLVIGDIVKGNVFTILFEKYKEFNSNNEQLEQYLYLPCKEVL